MSIEILQPRFRLELNSEDLRKLYPVFQKGFLIRIKTGCSLHTLMCENWGWSPGYVMDRISTVFLDGKPVDDLETTVARNGCALALSSAMPGLVGAVMRKGGFFASLRSSITHRESNEAGAVEDGIITVKLFNNLMDELGPYFLNLGMHADAKDLKNLFPTRSMDFPQDAIVLVVNIESEC